MQVPLGCMTGVLLEPRCWPVRGTFPSTPHYRPSLTTPAVSRVFLSFFLFLITELAHTSPLTHEACPFRSSLLTCGTLTCSARPVSVHQFSVAHQTSLRSRFNHDELFELPLLQGRRVA